MRVDPLTSGGRSANAWKFAYGDATLIRKVSTAASTENAPDEDDVQQVRDDASRITLNSSGHHFPSYRPKRSK